MTYVIKDCIWNDTGHTSFNCLWTHPDLGEIPFTASKNDVDPVGKGLFDWAIESTEIAEPDPEKLLADAKAVALAEINAAANKAKSDNIKYQGVTYQADTKSEKALNERITILQASGNTDAVTIWIAADNTTHEFGFADLSKLSYSIAKRNQKIVLQARTKKDAIEKAETLKTVVTVMKEVLT